ncbi:uncharacterized protein LOC122888741 isoform X2 [Siniperca chuatsi]|uniref:uncharacterized protein LOC122888741 isoform X2 n=1 Tax=Siniperca chuatsi TaxID=119488 RepID=UPI001CE0647B|nr:uncharacterized protein LOC122888741 isoform X2 [Siniperca chuatsi]
MGRYKCRVKPSRDSGLPNKRDTPVKTALSRRDNSRRLLPTKRYEAFPEEPEVEEVKPTVKPTNPVFAFKGGEMRVKEEKQNLAVTPENITSSSMESNPTFSSDGDEEDYYSSATTTSSSLPSPEIFRKESYVETLTFPIKEELLGLHLHIKNSTLLDVSHAESIHMYHPPNLSTIIDTSAILAEKNCEINKHTEPEAETKIHTDSFKSDKSFKRKPPPKVTNRRPILCKKKVWFKSPIIAETFEAKHIPATKLTIHNSSGPVQTSSPAEQMKPDADRSRAGLINSKEEALRLTVTLERPVKNSPEKAKFFDFVNSSDRNAFFQRMRERRVKLRSAPLFPLTAVKHTEPSVL